VRTGEGGKWTAWAALRGERFKIGRGGDIVRIDGGDAGYSDMASEADKMVVWCEGEGKGEPQTPGPDENLRMKALALLIARHAQFRRSAWPDVGGCTAHTFIVSSSQPVLEA
jgi:hypothetical protein